MEGRREVESLLSVKEGCWFLRVTYPSTVTEWTQVLVRVKRDEKREGVIRSMEGRRSGHGDEGKETEITKEESNTTLIERGCKESSGISFPSKRFLNRRRPMGYIIN